MHLAFRDDRGEPRSFSLADRPWTLVGRDDARDLVIPDTRVSRLHAAIERVGESCYLLYDRSSANGTFVNGTRIVGGAGVSLREGDVIEIGSTRIVVQREPLGAGTPDERDETEESSPDLERASETHVELPVLLDEGLAAIQARHQGRDETWTDTLRAFAGLSQFAGCLRALGILAGRVELDTVALYFRKVGVERLQLVSSWPGEGPEAELETLGTRALERGEGVLWRAPLSDDGVSFVGRRPRRGFVSRAAVPIQAGTPLRLAGVLVAERKTGERLERRELGVLAVFAQRLARHFAASPRHSDTWPLFVLT